MKPNNRANFYTFGYRIGLIAIVVVVALGYISIMIELPSFLAKAGIHRIKKPTSSSIDTTSSSTSSITSISISSNRSKGESIDGNDDGIISTGNWWDNYVDQLARPWVPYMHNPKNVNVNTTVAFPSSYSYDWCIPAQEELYGMRGLVFVKNPKAASSTGAGVTKRIAIEVGKRVLTKNNNDDVGHKKCLHYWKHSQEFCKRIAPVLLWTNVRYPPKKALSRFFHFDVSRRKVKPTTETMIQQLHSQRNVQIKYLSDARKINPKEDLHQIFHIPENGDDSDGDKDNKSTHESSSSTTTGITTDTPTTSKNNQVTIAAAIEHIQTHIMNAYNFMALVERMDESLVIFKLLFGLDDADMIVLSAKSSGGYDDGEFRNTCFKIQKAVTTPAVDDFIANNFTVQNYDYLLYAAVNKSLDLTIESLGGSAVIEEHVQQHQRMQQIATYYCQEQAKFPCSANGTLQNALAQVDCYWSDTGCGYQCVDRVLKEYQEGRLKWPVPS